MKAVLLFDPNRRSEQLAFVRERAKILHEFGDQIWVSMAEEQMARFADQGIQVQPQEAADLIKLPAVVFDPEEVEPAPPAELAATEPTGDDTAYYLVQFKVAPEPDWIQAVEDLGGVFVEDVPIHAVVFRFTSAQAAEASRLEESVSWVGLYHPAYALSFELAGREEPFSAENLRDLRVDSGKLAPQPAGAVRVSFFSDRSIEEMRPAVEVAGAEVVDDTSFDLILNISADRVPTLLRTPGVKSLEEHRPAGISSQRAGIILGANQVRNFGNVDFLVNLDGTGEIVGVVDTGLDNGVTPTAHTDFHVAGGATSRIISITNLNPPPVGGAPFVSLDATPHGTLITGCIAADGRNAPPPGPASPNNSVPRGIAPACQIIFHSVNAFAVPPVAPAVPPLNFNRFLRCWQQAYAGGARVHNNSFTSRETSAYVNVSEWIDLFAFLNSDAVIVFSVGNNEADLNNNGTFDQNSLGRDVVGKNILTIGASENLTNLDGDGRNYLAATGFNPPLPNCVRFGTGAANPLRVAATAAGVGVPATFPMSDNPNDIALFSNRGRVQNLAAPTRRRVKPDLVAPGTNILTTFPVGFALPPAIGQLCPPFAGPAIAVPNPAIARTAPNGLPLGGGVPAAPGYLVAQGTSIAAPLVSGACALVRQFYRQRFGQLRRPFLLEQETAFVDLPAAAPHTNGCVLAWIHRDAGAGQNHLVAAQYSRQLVRATAIVQIATNVGDHPAIAVARHASGNTVVLHRDSGNVLHLSLRNGALTPVGAFGAAGVVSLAPASRPEDDRRPTVAVQGDEIGVAWFQTGTDNLVFQRFRADTGAAIDAAAKVIGTGTGTSNHPYLVHNGVRWAAVWSRSDGTNFHLMMRFIDNAGNPEGAQPFTLLTQDGGIREPHLVWDARQGRFLVAFVSGNVPPARGVRTVRITGDGTVFGIPVTSVALATRASRRPRVGLHPDSGFVLLWEDDTQGTHDLYFSFLDPTGAPAAVNRMQISDTPNAISGFSALVDADGILPVWQSNDEINSDLLGVYALAVTKNGVFQAQANPATPLLQEQFYVRQTLIEHDALDLVATAMAWGGGDHYLLRSVADGMSADLFLVRTNADGRPDTALGAARISRWISYDALCLLWIGNRLIAGRSSLDSMIYLLESDGRAVATFGNQGALTLNEPSTDQIFLQVAQRGTGANFRVFVAYGRRADPGPHTIRYTVRNATGGLVGGGTVAPRDLVQASGTAKQGWFHLVSTDVPVHIIAAWHIQVGANMAVRVNRFQLNGTPQAGAAAPIPLTGLAGDAQNAVIAPRPIFFAPAGPLPIEPVVLPPTSPANLTNSRRREYGAAWQHRPAGGNWQIMFSRLQRNGRPSATAGQFDVVVVQSATDHATEPQFVWHTDGYGLAWLQQPVAGGDQQIFFTLLDQNGARPNLAATGAPAAPATSFAVSAASADVKRFHLVWSGRAFRITWTEIEGVRIRHMQRAIAVPRVAGGVRYDAPFQQPSSALVRATLMNGATNIRNTALPNFGNNVNDGYGWGRVNLRQALAPAPPVTFHARDDGVVADGRTVRYEFQLPPETQFLRITLGWTDPPGNNLVNHLHLQVTTPPFVPGGVRVFHGNRWQVAAGSTHLSTPINPAAPPPFEDIHNVQQVVISGPPALPAGTYVVEVIANAFGGSAFQQFPGQPFALVFVGSGPELRTAGPAPGGPLPVY